MSRLGKPFQKYHSVSLLVEQPYRMCVAGYIVPFEWGSACQRQASRSFFLKSLVQVGGIKIKGIVKGLMQTSKSLREKIKKMQGEKTELLAEIEELRKMAEDKASVLEKEVASLRKEAESLKKLVEGLE